MQPSYAPYTGPTMADLGTRIEESKADFARMEREVKELNLPPALLTSEDCIERIRQTAKDILGQRTIEDLIPTLTCFKQEDPELRAQHIKIAELYEVRGKYDKAFNEYKKAFVHTKSLTDYSAVPALYEKTKEWEKAALANLHLADFQLQNKESESAIKTLEHAKVVSPSFLNKPFQIFSVITTLRSLKNPSEMQTQEAMQGSSTKELTPSITMTTSDTLDFETIALLENLSKKSKQIFDAAELSEHQSIQAVLSNPAAIQNLIASRNEEEQALGELALLRKKELPYKYYQTFYQKLTGICLASYTIKCGMVGNASRNALDYIGSALSFAGQVTTIAGPLAIIGGILKLKNIKDNNFAVANLTLFFADLDQSLKDIKTIALLLAREREKDLLSLKPQGMFEISINTLKDWFTADESNNSIVVRAVEDCQTLLEALLVKELQPQASPEEVVSHILGKPPSVSAPVATLQLTATTVTSATIFSASSIDAASNERVQSLEEQLNDLKARAEKAEAREKELHRRTKEAERKADLAHAYAEAAFGPLVDFGNQVQMQNQTDPTKAKSPGIALLQGMNRAVQEVNTRTDQHAVALAVAHELITSVEQRQEDSASNKSKKKGFFKRMFS